MGLANFRLVGAIDVRLPYPVETSKCQITRRFLASEIENLAVLSRFGAWDAAVLQAEIVLAEVKRLQAVRSFADGVAFRDEMSRHLLSQTIIEEEPVGFLALEASA